MKIVSKNLKLINNLLILGLFLFFQNMSFAEISNYYTDQKVKDYIKVSKKINVKLPPGEWEVTDRWVEEGFGLKFSVMSLVRQENNELAEVMEIAYSKLAGAHIHAIDHALNEVIFYDQYDGCYQRPEYYLVELYRKGSTHNCMIVSHIDVDKELNNPDDPTSRGYLATTKQWIRSNNQVKIPPIMLESFHSYFSRLVGGYWVGLSYGINPKLLNAPESKFLTEETSEYHKSNIQRFPKYKNIMEKWISISSTRHLEFESLFNAKTRHRLRLNKYIMENGKLISSEANIADKLKTLNNLYKDGALTKEEFEKAKKKLLN